MNTTDPITTRRAQMNLMNEDLARAHPAQRLGEAQDLGLGRRVDRARRITRRADRVAHHARLALARSL